MNKKDLSRYFSGNAFSRMPLNKALIALCCVLAITVSTGAGIAFTAVNAANNSSSVSASSEVESGLVPSATPTVSATPSPVPTPEPIQLSVEATAVQQSIGITVMNAQQEVPVLGEDFEVTLEYVPDKKSNAKVKDPIQTYKVDPKTGTLLVKQVEIGDYKVTVAEREGYIAPEAITVQVKEKVQYKADIEAVKDEIKQASEVNEAKEDNGNISHSGAGSGSGKDPTLVLPTQKPTPPPSNNDYDYNESGVEERKATVYIPETQEKDGRRYLLYSDGQLSPYYVKKTAKAQDGTEFLVNAVLEPAMIPTPAPVPTPVPTPAPTPVPEETPIPDSNPDSVPESPSGSDAEQAAAESVLFRMDLGRFGRGTGMLAAGANMALNARGLEPSLLFYDEAAQQGIAHDGFKMQAVEKVLVTLYSGWYPSVEDKQAYYDPTTHEKVTGSKMIAGTRYEFDENGVLVKEETNENTENTESNQENENAGTQWTKGVDVSKYQGNIDWNQVKASGVEFAIIRVGYRGYGSGVLVEDSKFRQNIQGATNAGLKVGLYFYSQAINEAEAVEEASMVVSLCRGYNISYPIYFDTEKVGGDTGRADTISRAQRTANAVAFCETIRNSGYRPGVYSYASWFYNQLNMASLSPYSIWIAQYRDQLSFDYNYDIWQYTSTAVVPGIPKQTDMNVSKLG